MEHTDNSTCKTCAAALSGPYCSQCGQKAALQRITVGRLLADLLRQITNLDRGLWYTVLMLFRNPGKVARDYIGGSTLRYFNPARYLLIWITVSFLLYFSLGQYDQQTAEMQQYMNPDASPDTLAFQEKWINFFKKYVQIFALILVPIYAFFTWLFFRKQSMNYAEHLAANAYFTAQTTILGVLAMPFLVFAYDSYLASMLSSLCISTIYYSWVFRSLFAQRWVSAFFKSAAVIFLSFLGYIFGIMIIGVVFGIIYTLSNKI